VGRVICFSKKSRISPEQIFDAKQDIQGKWLLLQAEFTTDNWLLKALGFIGLNRILPVGNKIHLKLGFKNIGTEEIQGDKDVVDWIIFYPQGSLQYRHWHLKIPHLNVGDSRWTKPEWLFMPEVPGHHTMFVLRPSWFLQDGKICKPKSRESQEPASLKYAAPYGLIGRKYALTDDNWKASLYVLNRGEYITIIIIMATIILAFLSLLLGFFNTILVSTSTISSNII
jgi:hypothetical protein